MKIEIWLLVFDLHVVENIVDKRQNFGYYSVLKMLLSHGG